MPNKLIKNYNPLGKYFLVHKDLFFAANDRLIINNNFNDKKYVTDNSGICKKDYNSSYFGFNMIV